jgi:Fanconi anemia group M protein
MYDIFARSGKERRVTQTKPEEVIEVDFREKNSTVPAELKNLGLAVEFKELKVADYIVKGIAVERKEARDFFSSVFDKRIFSQMTDINQYEKNLLIIEGDLKKYNRMNENALRGILLSILLSFRVPIIFSKDEKETAVYLALLANKKKKKETLIPKKRSLSPSEELEFIIEAFPGIGPVKAKKILEKFGTIKEIINSKEEDLEPILGKGSKDFMGILKRTYFH